MKLLPFLLLLPALVACSPAERAGAPDELPTTLTAQDAGWPRYFAADGEAVTIYQPQVESWHRYSRITFRAAVSFTPEGAEKPVFGALRVEADTDTDLENRGVLLGNMEITGSKFVGLGEAESAEWTRRIGGILPAAPVPVDLDRILAYFEHTEAEVVADDLAGKAPATPGDEIAHDAPRIFVSQRPAILVVLDGEPVLFPVEGTALMFAVNTNWDLFFHSKEGRYYLLDRGPSDEEAAGGGGQGSWLTAARLDGPWTVAGEMPGDFLKLGDDWQDVKENLPGAAMAEVPTVYAVTRPAELIVIDGAAASTPIEGTRLLWVQNTDADLFLYGGDGRYYYLVSGRWYRTQTLDGPWELASADLPGDFAAIPADHPTAGVLASVPGTAQAEEAVRLAKVPTKATVKRSEATAEVAYQGDPELAAIEGTSSSPGGDRGGAPLEYATNTASDVIKVGDVYYLCLQGVWFVSTSATGPWQVADSVAQEIYTIPPSSPVHHTTYVQVYDSGPDWVTVGYTAAYLGLMIAIFDDAAVVVYGTGWYYPPYVYYGPHPVYYPYHHSYGVSAWYNPTTGTYGRGASVYGPYGGAGRAAAYNPRTGTYARGAAAYGPYGGSATFQAYNPRTSTYRAGYRSYNTYASWGEGVVERGDKWAKGGYYSDSRGTVAGVRTSEGTGRVAVRTDDGRTFIGGSGNDVFVGKDGDVYRRGNDGWSKYDQGDWQKAESSGQARLSESQRAAAQDRASAAQSRGGTTAAGVSESQRAAARDRASQTARPSWDRGASQNDVLNQLNRDSQARSAGAQRSRDFKSSRSSGGTRSRTQSGRSRGGRRGG